MSCTGIIIVTYNSAAEIGRCLDAACATGSEVLVVDNASTDGTLAEVSCRGVNFIANRENRGFAAAVNQGFKVLNCPYVLILNPDAVIQGSLEPLNQACDLPGSAGAGGRLIGPDGALQIGFMVRNLPRPASLILESLLLNRCWPGNPVNQRYRCLREDYSVRFPAEQPAGAFLMVRRQVWEDLGGLDESFAPIWFDDVDFCCRIRDRGLNLYFVPEATAIHSGGHSMSGLTLEIRRFYWYRSLLRYSHKHFRPTAFRVVCLSVATGSVIRGIGESLLKFSLQPLAACARVVRIAGHGLLFGSLIEG
jgi:GT2 family glycosyltransferase